MLSPRILTTLFCQNLLHATDEPIFTHLTLHIPLRTIAGTYRISCEGRLTTLSFYITPQRCLGFSLEEHLDGPRLFSWLNLGEYQAHNPEPLPESAPWSVLLGLFATVDVLTDLALHTGNGSDLAATAPYMTLYRIFD